MSNNDKNWLCFIGVVCMIFFVLSFTIYQTGRVAGCEDEWRAYMKGYAKAWADYEKGFDDGARSRPDPRDDPNDWRRAAFLWRGAAEHYGGICKWLLENKPIYGTIAMDSNTTLTDCLIVSGSKEASVVVDGASGYITNNHFAQMDMEWILSLTPVDPNAEKPELDWGAAAEAVDVIWPDVFTNPDAAVYEDSQEGRLCALADGLSGWACAMVDTSLPESFGAGMAKIGCFLDITATRDELLGLHDEYKKTGYID